MQMNRTATTAATDGVVRDFVGVVLLIVFLVKPTVDLFWEFSVSLGPFRLSPLTVSGLLLLALLLPARLNRQQYVPPLGRLLEIFLLLNIIGALIGLMTSRTADATHALNVLTRMADSYLIYFTAYAAARREQYGSGFQFLRAALIGTGFAVLVNVVAIQLGYGGAKWDSEFGGDDTREVGLYYDSGVLANAAFYNLVFALFWFHATRMRLGLKASILFVLIVCDLYLIAAAQSRVVIVQLLVAIMIYLVVYRRGSGRISALIGAVAVVGAVALLLGQRFLGALERFEGDVTAVQSVDAEDIGRRSGNVSLGTLESLGNNRGALWAAALTEIFEQDFPQVAFGDFFTVIGAHSDYIDVLARNGFVGLAVYLLLIYGTSLRTWLLARENADRNVRALRCLAFILIACYVLYCFPFRPLMYTTTNWYMWTIIALAYAGRHSRQPVSAPQTRRPARRMGEDLLNAPADTRQAAHPPPLRGRSRSQLRVLTGRR